MTGFCRRILQSCYYRLGRQNGYILKRLQKEDPDCRCNFRRWSRSGSDPGKELKVVVEKDPFRICVYDKEGTMIHADIVDLAYREDSNHRRIHTSQIEADDCFYGFGEKSGELNKAQKYMVLSPGDSMGYDPKETDSLYKHIPFYIKLNQTTKKAVGYFYHSTWECDFNMGREKRNYWHRYSSYSTNGGDIDLFLLKDLLCARL